jgi:hypothetical protein
MNNQLEKIVEALNMAETCILQQQAEIERLRSALESISRSTCCDQCQEAALFARAALKGEGDD